MSLVNKQFLDIEGLQLYTSKILSLIAEKADASSIEKEIENLKNMVGDVNLLGENYKNLVLALLAEIDRAKKAEDKISNQFEWGTLGI